MSSPLAIRLPPPFAHTNMIVVNSDPSLQDTVHAENEIFPVSARRRPRFRSAEGTAQRKFCGSGKVVFYFTAYEAATMMSPATEPRRKPGGSTHFWPELTNCSLPIGFAFLQSSIAFAHFSHLNLACSKPFERNSGE